MVVCEGLGKNFVSPNGKIDALKDITFSLQKGRIVGLLGPDGSGKSTLLRILAGLLRPDTGTSKVLGLDSVKDAKRLQTVVGYMPQRFGLYENLTVEENLSLYADLNGVSNEIKRERMDGLLELTRLARFSSRFAGKLSGGMKQKLALACALVGNPELLLLDEPTVGVDVLSRRELWKILRQISAEKGTSVLVSTSYMDEADYCDWTLVLFQGRLLADEAPSAIRNSARDSVSEPTFEQGFQKLISGKVFPPLVRHHPSLESSPVQIDAKELVKRFGDFTAVNHLSFSVHRGEIFGLLGANGAGKTTTFRMLCGLDAPTEGKVTVAGYDLRKASGKARAQIGFVAQKFSLYGDLTLRENLRFFGSAYGLHGKHLEARYQWALDEFSLKSYEEFPTDTLPLGIKQRLSMACALLHEPEILFLDEATSGADPITRREFWGRINQLADQGVSVIITTHFLDEAEYCDRMIIMQDGVAVAMGNVNEIRQKGTPSGEPLVSLEDAFVAIIQGTREEDRQ